MKETKKKKEKVKVQGRKTARGLWAGQTTQLEQGHLGLHEETLPHKTRARCLPGVYRAL